MIIVAYVRTCPELGASSSVDSAIRTSHGITEMLVIEANYVLMEPMQVKQTSLLCN
jgi:hypothetical protein